MPDAEIPLAEGQMATADDTAASTQSSVNWMVDAQGCSIMRPAIVNTKLQPGYYAASTGTLTGIIGLYIWKNLNDGFYYAVYVRKDGYIFAKNLSTNSLVSASSSSTATSILQLTAPGVTFTEDTQRLLIAGGGQIQAWTGVGLSTRIGTYTLGVSQPSQAATHVVYLGGYLIANQTFQQTSNQILWSNLGDGSHGTWNPLNFNTADASPDAVVALAVNLRECAAFGTATMQVFGLGGDATLPFVSSGATLAIGCSAPYSVIVYDGRYVWLDDNRRFVMSDGRSYATIAEDISKLIRDYTTVADCRGFRIQIGYWDLLVFTFPTAGKAWAYDTKTKQTFQWNGWDNATGMYSAIRMGSYAYYSPGNYHIVGDPNYENLWTLDISSTVESGPNTALVADKITRRLDQGSAGRKCCRNVRLFVKRGTTAQGTAPTSAAFIDVSKNDDDRGWSEWKRLSLGIAGDSTSYVDWRPGGIYRRRQYRFRYSAPVPVAISKVIETWEPFYN